MELKIEHRAIQTNGVELHTVYAGPENGNIVVLLHGFPEYWRGFRRQIEYLAGAGFRVIVPDQRGYNLSGKPGKISDYDIDLLAGDIVGIIDSLPKQKICLVGHDWGGVVAWWIALKFPDRLKNLTVLNAPHPVVMSRALKASWSQILKSWYVVFFQIPFVPEWLARCGNFAFLVRSLKGSSRRGTFSDEDMAHYREAWRRPGALRSMIHWYRASLKKSMETVEKTRIGIPTLVIWGEQDTFLGKELAAKSAALCERARITFLPEATHWLQHEEPDKVNALLRDFLKDDSPEEYLAEKS
ncbi:MAG: alpha/beta hydrolase [Deltaproteobacteria bacterium]|nr:alpha/beta hydrolase [Deltaproteobacteria bacterium]